MFHTLLNVNSYLYCYYISDQPWRVDHSGTGTHSKCKGQIEPSSHHTTRRDRFVQLDRQRYTVPQLSARRDVGADQVSHTLTTPLLCLVSPLGMRMSYPRRGTASAVKLQQYHTAYNGQSKNKINETVNKCSLFGGVVELVLIGAAEALLHAGVRPQPLHRRQQLLAERFRVLHPLDHVEHHLTVALQQRVRYKSLGY